MRKAKTQLNPKMSNTLPIDIEQPGALPLKSEKMEAYARERCLGISPTQALAAAGYAKSIARVRPNYLENDPRVKDRIAYLARDHADVVRAKRQKLEAYLWLALESDRADF